MAAFFHSGEGRVELEVGETATLHTAASFWAAVCPSSGSQCHLETGPKSDHKPRYFFSSVNLLWYVLRGVCVFLVCVGLLEEQLCPQGWLKFRASCYFFSRRRDNWANSRIECLRAGADLVIINDPQEQAFLTGFSEAAWVGMTDMKEEGTWLWVDGTPVEDSRVRWAQGQPDGAYGGEDCGELHFMNNFINLNDYNCNTRLQWICEKKTK
ncbi:CD209 antigen-like protein E [Synchiropus splendidus]|uniref:CD209 antigen-like protein E n=1 Tax=Synchiropus splendidus TaxID=270530 RepID=UPI00237E39F0|nr:CD209 antigen-like protein E [Synchiropus splendidus]